MIQFKMQLSPGRPAQVEVAGEEVKSLRSAAVKAELGDVPRVYLEFLGEGIIEGEGIVTIVKDLDQRQAVAEWLANIDGSELEREVLERMGWATGSTGEVTLEVLREWVGRKHGS